MLPDQLLIHLEPSTDKPEGAIIKYIFQLLKRQDVSTGPRVQTFTHNSLEQFIELADKLLTQKGGFQSAYERVVEYVNTNYGMVTVREHKTIDKLKQQLVDSNPEFEFDSESIKRQFLGLEAAPTYHSILDIKPEELDQSSYINAENLRTVID